MDSSTHKAHKFSDCTKLLPNDADFDGAVYNLTLQTTIDSTAPGAELDWGIEMNDGRQEEISDSLDDKLDRKIEPFIGCILQFIQ